MSSATLFRARLANAGFVIIVISYLLIIFSSPMPFKIGAVEILMGTGLTIAALLLGFSFVTQKDGNLRLLISCLAYFLLIPLLVGFLHENAISDIVRDVVPLMFLSVLPVLIKFLPKDKNGPSRIRVLMGAIVFVGLVSSFQFYHGITQMFGSMKAFVTISNGSFAIENVRLGKAEPEKADVEIEKVEPKYQMVLLKTYEPAVLFTAIFLLCTALELILVKPRRFLLAFLALGAGVFCAYEFFTLGLRAYSGLTVLAVAIYTLHLARAIKVPIVNLVAVLALVLVLVSPFLMDTLALMWSKQQAVGANGKLVEFYGVLDSISGHLSQIMFGVGWGGVFSNPIYDTHETTRFTHSLLSFWLLKTGVVGFMVMILFVFLLFRKVRLERILASSHSFAIFLAASVIIIIGLFFQPIYKMLSFGLIVGLLLAELTSFPVKEREISVKR